MPTTKGAFIKHLSQPLQDAWKQGPNIQRCDCCWKIKKSVRIRDNRMRFLLCTYCAFKNFFTVRYY